jgi:hypothetical protein
MCPDSDVNELAQLAGNEASVVAQKGEGLAAGLTSVFAHFAEDHQRRIIAFNSDSPHCRVLFSKTRSKRWPHMT